MEISGGPLAWGDWIYDWMNAFTHTSKVARAANCLDQVTQRVVAVQLLRE